MIKIAIIGAGSAGMAMAKQIIEAQKETEQEIQFTLFERRKEVGGIWQLDEDVKESRIGWEQEDGSIEVGSKIVQGKRFRLIWQEDWPPGAMFSGLRTNIPSDLMSFRDFYFDEKADLYPSREIVQKYLEKYANEFNLRDNVQFSTNVERIVKDEETNGWRVFSKSISNEDQPTKEEHFTHLVLAHGRCSTPNIPTIDGLTTFKGRIMHSAWYRDPTTLLRPGERRKVLVVGNSSSGMDIARELSGFITRTLPCGLNAAQWSNRCKEEPFEVLSSWHSPDNPPPLDYNPLDPESPEWCKRIKVVERISSIQENRIILADGTVLEGIPLIVFATGFLFDNPFLDQSKGDLQKFPLLPPSNNPQKVGFPSPSIYNVDDWFLFHSKDPTLVMLGLPITVIPFPFTEIQAMFVIYRWLDKVPKLPLLDSTISATDEKRWSSTRNSISHLEDQEVVLHTISHVFGKPSDSAYLETLLRMLQSFDKTAGTEVPWKKEYKSDGKGKGFPKGPEDRYAISPWRMERRFAGRSLRRETLGY